MVVRLPDGDGRSWFELHGRREVHQARTIDEVRPVLERVERATAGGLHAGGYMTYEAAPAFDPALVTRPPTALPLVWFGLFEARRRIELPAPVDPSPFGQGRLEPEIGREAYEGSVGAIHAAIARGDTYQINFTLRLTGRFDADPWDAFLHLVDRQPVPHAAFVDTGRWVVCSASPELFVHRDGDRVTSRPMKGTAPRGRWPVEDDAAGEALGASAKNRAENLMIVDMVRNDLGRVAEPGTVAVPALFDVERFATLWQMTSTVTARTDAGLVELLAALYPCASITGAPKASSMRLIAELERSPRGVYTGAVGWLGPGRQAELAVGIRTLVVDREEGTAAYGTGSGIVWDSRAEDEYEECWTKALVVREAPPPFRLLETLAWHPEGGFRLLRSHLDRLVSSAGYFGFEMPSGLEARLGRLAADFGSDSRRVRVLLDRDGEVELEAAPLGELPGRWRLAVASTPVDGGDPWLFHKTTHREVYERAMAEVDGADDAVLFNARGEVTETTIGNLVVEIDGRRMTPPVECGLLAGTFREQLLARGAVEESVVRVDDLDRAEAIWMVSSVRGWVTAELVSAGVRATVVPQSAPDAGVPQTTR